MAKAGRGSRKKAVRPAKKKAKNKAKAKPRKKKAVRRTAPARKRVPAAKRKPRVAKRKPRVAKKKAPAAKKKAVPARRAPAARASTPRPAPGKAPARRGTQGAIQFEGESPRAHATPEPPPRRRSSKQGGPDWPGENLTVGMAAPEFSLPSTLGRRITLSEFRGKRVILYFYPKDDTPGCTMEACAFRDNLPRIEAKDAVVLGISLDDELSHQRFAQKYSLPFPLLSDVDAAVSRQYGVYKEKSLYGRSFWGIERTTFVVDREGKVENVFRRVKVEGHADEVLATLAV